MSVQPPAASKPYRWVEIQHEDLDFYSVPRPFPWPREADAEIDPEKDFPFRTLIEGIRLLLADTEVVPNPVWKSLMEIVDAGDELVEAFETPDLAKAEKILDRLDRLHPNCPFVYFNKAFVVRQRGNKKESLQLYQAAVDAAPNLEFLWMRLGELAEEMGHTRQATAAYRKAQALLAPHPQALEGLARLGALKRVEQVLEGGKREVVYVTQKEFRRIILTELDGLAHDRRRLKALLEQLLLGNDGPLSIVAARKLLEHDPDDFETLRSLAEAYRLAGHLEEAEEYLNKCLARSPKDAWCHYLLGWVRFDQKDHASGWACMHTALDLDPNLHAAIVCQFGLKPGQNDPARERRLAAWAAEKKSFQGYLLASIQARDRGDQTAALQYGAKAYELAPDNKMVVLQYTGLLGQAGEKEWMAALAKRFLASGHGDYQVKYQFANALHDLGLNDDAIKVLQNALTEDKDVPPDWQEALQARIDKWSGRIAESEVALERFGDGVLRRPVVLVLENQEPRELLPAGAPLPQRKLIQLTLKNPVSSICLCLEQGYARGYLEPLRLGYFRMDDIDVAKLETETPDLRLVATEDGTLQVWAQQGERKLPVTWSLYPAPMAE
jgi:tetratricopeptide (TPR) repeat protein